MSTPSRVCLFCRQLSRPHSNYVPSFLTYLKTINALNLESNYENGESFPPEDFHCCGACGSLLDTISADVQKLRGDLLKIYTITVENLDRNEALINDNDVLENLRRKSVAHPLPIDLILVPREESCPDYAPILRDQDNHVEEQVKIKIEEETGHLDTEIGVKVEPEEEEENAEIGEFILPDFVDPLRLQCHEYEYPHESNTVLEEAIVATPSSSKRPRGRPRKTPLPELLVAMGDTWGRRREKSKYICALCRSRFSSLGGYNTHMETHSRNEEYLHAKLTCPWEGCGSIFYAVAKQEKHVEVVHGRKPFSCPSCPKAFGRKELLAIHEEFNHPGTHS